MNVEVRKKQVLSKGKGVSADHLKRFFSPPSRLVFKKRFIIMSVDPGYVELFMQKRGRKKPLSHTTQPFAPLKEKSFSFFAKMMVQPSYLPFRGGKHVFRAKWLTIRLTFKCIGGKEHSIREKKHTQTTGHVINTQHFLQKSFWRGC